ncbi:MAG: hypothetical protein MJ252_18850 [archaeon]|nr:hypothetical protein [archaeon]
MGIEPNPQSTIPNPQSPIPNIFLIISIINISTIRKEKIIINFNKKIN